VAVIFLGNLVGFNDDADIRREELLVDHGTVSDEAAEP